MCIFCKIVKKEIPANIVKEDDDFLAFRDINPKANTHILIIPKVHVDNFQNSELKILSYIGSFIQELATENGIENNYKLEVNNGSLAGQEVMHLHFHLLSSKKI